MPSQPHGNGKETIYEGRDETKGKDWAPGGGVTKKTFAIEEKGSLQRVKLAASLYPSRTQPQPALDLYPGNQHRAKGKTEYL